MLCECEWMHHQCREKHAIKSINKEKNIYVQSQDETSLIVQWKRILLQCKISPAVKNMSNASLGQEDPLEKKIATQSCILAWKISWTEEPGGLQWVQKELDTA